MTYTIPKNLHYILTRRREHGSKGERDIMRMLIAPTGATQDAFGNWSLRIGTAPVLWSCHTDTVHYGSERQVIQPLAIMPGDKLALLDPQKGDCLGADNGVGVWLMLEMIKAGKEGLYVFHRQEETGGKGSEFFAEHNEVLLKEFKMAIAFDRRGTTSIITYQLGQRCCSDSFAASLATELDMGHGSDPTGSFTDTANYTHLIPECTNISAGFVSEHSQNETLSLTYLYKLKEAVIALDINALVIERDPSVTEYDGAWGFGGAKEYTENKEMETFVYTNYDEVAAWLSYNGITVDMIKNFDTFDCNEVIWDDADNGKLEGFDDPLPF